MTDPKDPADCSEEAAQRAGAKQSSLNEDASKKPDADPDHSEPTEAELDEALEDSMDASDPPAALQP